jgi:8-oxo-dGTP pyrophosphatase MutT (NUDIX family)
MASAVLFGSRLEGLPYTERPAAYAVIFADDGSVASVALGNTKGRKRHWLPGGGCLASETPAMTIVREIREELGRGIRLLGKIGEAKECFYARSEDCYYEMVAVFFAAGFSGKPDGRPEFDLCWLSAEEREEAFFHQSHVWAVRQARAGPLFA